MRIGNFIGTMGAADSVQGQAQQAVEAEADGFDYAVDGAGGGG